MCATMDPLTWFFCVLVFLLLLLHLLMFQWPSLRRYRLVQKLPGPPGQFILGNSLELAQVPYESLLLWLVERAKLYPRIMRLWIMGLSIVILTEPDDVQVLLTNSEQITKSQEYRHVKPWLKEGLLTSTGSKWHRRRKLLTPTFHFRILEDSMSTFSKNSLLFCGKLAATGGKPISIETLVNNCTLDIICEAAMGINIRDNKAQNQRYIDAIRIVTKIIIMKTITFWMDKPWIFNFIPTGREFYKNLDILHNFTKKVINDRRKTFSLSNGPNEGKGKAKRAFLDALLDVEARNPGSLTTEDIAEEVDTFMFEGHDTTASAIVFSLFNLGTYPDIQERVYREVEEVLGDEREPAVKDLQSLHYLDRVIKETLRLYPSAPYFSRHLEKDLVLGDGVIIPASSNVGVLPFAIQRKEEFYPEPQKFDPERWSEDNSASRHPFSYIPFSAGPRNCIGQKFAMLEIKMLLSQVVRKFRIETVTKPEEVTVYNSFVLKSIHPIVCKFIPR